ncbi:MAG: hypothetical protein IJT41_04850 [Clostridia bacterium]|nr:hypothetical protein [Clostridia bacterium]
MKKIIALFLVLTMVGGAVYYFFFYKTDDEKIAARLSAFEKSYASGDMDGIMKCFDTKSRNAYKGIGTLGSMFGGKAGPFSFNFGGDTISSLFSLGVATLNLEIKITIQSISYTDDQHAVVAAELWSSENYIEGENTEPIIFNMVKEKNEWYISEDFSF